MNQNCTPMELKQKLDNGQSILLLDVRTPEELELASIEQARNIPLDELPERLSELEAWRENEIIVMCHHGARSAMAQGFLIENGFTNVSNLIGGIDAYACHADPTVSRY